MNENVKKLISKVKTDTSGKWVNISEVEAFTALIVAECCQVLGEETIRHDGYGYNQHALYRKIREHFGVEL